MWFSVNLRHSEKVEERMVRFRTVAGRHELYFGGIIPCGLPLENGGMVKIRESRFRERGARID